MAAKKQTATPVAGAIQVQKERAAMTARYRRRYIISGNALKFIGYLNRS